MKVLAALRRCSDFSHDILMRLLVVSTRGSHAECMSRMTYARCMGLFCNRCAFWCITGILRGLTKQCAAYFPPSRKFWHTVLKDDRPPWIFKAMRANLGSLLEDWCCSRPFVWSVISGMISLLAAKEYMQFLHISSRGVDIQVGSFF